MSPTTAKRLRDLLFQAGEIMRVERLDLQVNASELGEPLKTLGWKDLNTASDVVGDSIR